MAKLTVNQESFIGFMRESEELARHGFNLLLKRPNFEQFFDALQEAGLFDASCNPAPEAAEKEGYVRIPYWSALDYLTAVARRSGETSDSILASKVMAVVRSVSEWGIRRGIPETTTTLLKTLLRFSAWCQLLQSPSGTSITSRFG